MKRNVRKSEKLLITGLSFIFLFMITQDLVPLGALNDVQAISADRSTGEIITVTLVGAGQILLLMGMALFFIGKHYPLLVKLWLIIHQSFIFSGALIDWWIPYFSGYGAEQRMERYDNMFGNTHSFLPVINGIVPNTLHVLFHSTLLACIIVTTYISVTDKKNAGSVEEEKNIKAKAR
ncbi:hypothetical protein [Salibacterium sp. K-3]